MSLGVGIHKRAPFDVYRAAEGLNFSRLKEMGRSPRHYQHRLDNPGKTTTSMTLGLTGHTAILEPHRFLAEYALWDERTDEDKVRPRRGKAWDTFVAAHPGKRIVKAAEYYQAAAMRDAVRGHKAAMRYLRRGDSEVSMVWADAEFGRLCKGRTDWLATVDGHDVLVGLKTARDCRPIGFGNASARLGYFLQWAFYFDGYATLTKKEPRVVEIVVESVAPHDVTVYDIPTDVIDAGRDEYRKLMTSLAECEASGDWPGSAEEEQILSLPSWVYQAEDDIAELGLDLT